MLYSTFMPGTNCPCIKLWRGPIVRMLRFFAGTDWPRTLILLNSPEFLFSNHCIINIFKNTPAYSFYFKSIYALNIIISALQTSSFKWIPTVVALYSIGGFFGAYIKTHIRFSYITWIWLIPHRSVAITIV